MGKSVWIIVGICVVGACKTDLSLSGFGKSKKPSSSDSSSDDDSSSSSKKSHDDDDDSDDSSSASEGHKGGGKVTPPPSVGKLESGKAPPWCKGYEKSSSDNLQWVKSYMDSDGLSWKVFEKMAMAACDKTDSERQEKVAEWATQFKTEFGATDKDFVEMMTYSVQKSEQRKTLEEEQCGPLKEKDEEASGEQLAERDANKWLFGCDDRMDDNVLYYFDLPQVTEVQRAAMVRLCIGNDDPSKQDKMRGEFAFCMNDMKVLDRAKFDKELAGMNVNLFGKVNATLNFNIQKTNAGLLLKKYAAKSKKDEQWASLLDAPQKGWDDWYTTYDANKDAFDAVKSFDKKAAKGSKKVMADCGTNLRTLWFDHVRKAKKLKNLETAQKVGTDAVGYPLMTAMMRCDAANGRLLAVSAAQDLFMQHAKESRGPRYAAYDATLGVLNDIRSDREKFPMDGLYPSPPNMGHQTWYKAYEQTFNKINYDHGTGQIKAVKKKGDIVHVTFKTVKWKEEEAYDCHDTRKIYRIDEEGHVEYEQKCKYKTVNQSSTLAAVDIPADFAEGLKSGMMLEVSINTKKDGTREAIPKGVYKDKEKKKLIGAYGLIW